MDGTPEEEWEVEALYAGEERILDKLSVYSFSQTWRFDVPLDRDQVFTSPTMRTRHEDEFDFSWRLRYHKSSRDNCYGNFTLALLRFDRRHLEVCVRCYIDDRYYQKRLTEERGFDLGAEPPVLKVFTLWDCDLQRAYREQLVEMLRTDHLYTLGSIPLVIRVEFEFSKMDYHVCTSLRLSDDLEAFMRRNEELADVTFEIGGEELKAHKCILAARSPVFAKMFAAQETRDNKHRIEDMEPDVFRHLLTFVYCGKTDDAKNKLPELRLAVEKFGMRM